MVRRIDRALVLLVWMAALCSVHGQTSRTVTLRLLDGKTGRVASSSGVFVLANHQPTVHGEWVKQNEDGTSAIKVPKDASVLLIRATYDDSSEYFVNCASPKQSDTPAELWYAVADIMATGVIAPNGCIKPKALEKLQVTAKPGELVLFVRKLNWREQSTQ